MSRDSRQNANPLAEQLASTLSGIDCGLEIERPAIDWRKAVAKRQSHRRTLRAAAGSLTMLLILTPLAWLASRPNASKTPQPIEIAHAAPEAAKQEIKDLDRQLAQLDRGITSLKRAQRKSLAAKVVKPAKPNLTDPLEEGALVLLAAAEKAQRTGGKEASELLYRRIIEIFPETRGAEIARQQLM